MSYKPLGDEELTGPDILVVSGVRMGKVTAARLVEQARRANRLAEALDDYRKSTAFTAPDPTSITWLAVWRALADYKHGDVP